MRLAIAYLTTDDVNLQIAQKFARFCRANLIQIPPKRFVPMGSSIPGLNDLDHLLSEHKEVILKGLLAGPVSGPVAVHGYGLDDGQIDRLRENSVLVSTSLVPSLVQSLCHPLRCDEGSIPIAETIDEESPTDPAELCRLVRSVAAEVHRELVRTSVLSPLALDELHMKIDHTRGVIDQLRRSHDLPLEELSRWLDQLVQKLRDACPERSA